jgi:chemotaxis protein MotB
MFQRIRLFTAVGLAGLLLSGCVSQNEYLQKQAEADLLSQGLTASRSEAAALRVQVDGLRADKNNLETQRNDLDASLAAKTQEMDQTVRELRFRTAELEGDIQMLKESISLLKRSREEEVRTVSKTYEELLGEMKTEIEQGQIAITELQGKLTVDVVDKILFDSGQAEVKPEGLQVLKRVVQILKGVEDKTIRVEGHTDNVRIAGALAKRYPTNWELSAARAINVTRYLQKEGIDPALLSAAAFGEFQPVADNETPEGRAKNRRIAIILLPRE